MDRIGIGHRVDHGTAIGLRSCDLQKAGAEPLVEGQIHPLETILASSPSLGPAESRFGRQIQDERQVWSEIADRDPMKRPQFPPIDPTAMPLIGHGRIGETIANYPLALVERRPDRIQHMAAARGHHQEGFGKPFPAPRLTLDDEAPDLLCIGRAARFAGLDRGYSLFAEGGDQPRRLGGFAGSLAAFERDEPAAGQLRLPQTRYPAAVATRPTTPSRSTDCAATSGNSTGFISGAVTTSLPTVAPLATGALI